MTRRTILYSLSSILVLLFATAALAVPPFLLGADISWLPEDEADGATYYDRGTQKDLLQLLHDHGFNAIRLRLFVNPGAAGGYASRRNEPFCDLAHTLAMAKRAKAAGMTLLLDFHYSDTWADPGKQFQPAAWKDLPFDQLKQALYDHTHAALLAMKRQGTLPEYVQIGNEITNGLLWPDGHIDHFDQFAELLKSGIAAAHDVDPSIQIVLHHDKGRTIGAVRWWLDNLLKRGVTFDVIGLSCYQQAHEGDWQTTLTTLSRDYPQFKLLIAEYSSRKRYVNDLAHDTPNCIGTFIWEPTRHKEAIFDQNGHNAGSGTDPNLIPSTRPTSRPTTRPFFTRTHGGRYDSNAFLDIYDQIAKDYHLSSDSH